MTLDNATCFRASATTELENGAFYRGPIWQRDGQLFILYGNKPFPVEKGHHWKTWKTVRKVTLTQ